MLILQVFTVWCEPAALTALGFPWPVGLLVPHPAHVSVAYLLLTLVTAFAGALAGIHLHGRRKGRDACRAPGETCQALLDNSLEMVFVADADGKFLDANDRALAALGYTREELPAPGLGDVLDVSQLPQARKLLAGILREGTDEDAHEFRLKRKDGSPLWVEVTCAPVQQNGGPQVILGMARDITGRKRADEERDRLIGELTEALLQIKTLHGLLPICAHCKKIRDDRGYWNKLENYISAHSEAQFSHGICPECAAQIYPRTRVHAAHDQPDC